MDMEFWVLSKWVDNLERTRNSNFWGVQEFWMKGQDVLDGMVAWNLGGELKECTYAYTLIWQRDPCLVFGHGCVSGSILKRQHANGR